MPNVRIPGVGVVAFPDTMPPRAIDAAVKRLTAKAEPPGQGGPDAAAMGLAGAGAVRSEMASRLGSLLPAAGGLGGGLAFNIPGATIGGMAGKALQLAIEHRLPASPAEGVREVGGAGVMQGGLQVAGNQATGLAAPASKALYGFALKMTKTAQKQFGDMAAVGLKRGLPVGKESVAVAGKGAEGVQREAGAAAKRVQADIQSEWSNAVGEVQRLLQDAEAAGARVTIHEIAAPLAATIERTTGKPLERKALNRLLAMVRREANELLGRSGYGLERTKKVTFAPTEAKLIKQAGYDETRGIQVARQRGDFASRANPERLADVTRGTKEALEGVVPGIAEAEGRVGRLIELRRAARPRGRRSGKLTNRAGEPMEATGDPLVDALLERAKGAFGLERAIASGRRAAPLHPWDWPGATGDPSLDALVGRSREAVGLERAMTDAASRQQPTMLPMMAGGAAFAGAGDPLGALLTALAARVALSPSTTSRAAIGLTKPAAADVLRQSPRTIEALIEQLFMQEPQGGSP